MHLKTKKDIRPKALTQLSGTWTDSDSDSPFGDLTQDNQNQDIMPQQTHFEPITSLKLPETGIPCPKCPKYFNDLRLAGFHIQM